jgi:osmotically-inducible protein OsmY
MSTEQAGRPRSAELEQAIKNRIVQRTGWRIQTLEVEVSDSCVVIRGCAPSYYLKQLALQGVLEVIGTAGATRIELDIQVASRPPKFDEQVD